MQLSTPETESPILISERVYNHLENEILSGVRPGGSRLRVREIAEQVETSVIPVRDAISRLEAAGLAQHVPYKGAIVKEFSTTELLEIYNVRTLLEEKAAYDGTVRITPERLNAMRTANEKSAQALGEGKLLEAINFDTEMIRILYQAAGNGIMLSVIETLWKQCQLYRLIAFRNAYEHNDSSMRDSQLIVLEAAFAKDPAAAQRATRNSIEFAKLAIALRSP
ncbi:MAG: GntR family transcriptional regulator [Gulosibacter sp.]|uniref:GntR family transcriptional regulator n=1 Tax=Gulosibacter sp. TaxID=2817531 RepID=UPI003F91087E